MLGGFRGSFLMELFIIHITYLSGIIPNIDNILNLARANNLVVIEDISQAYGATFEKKKVGTFA